MMSSKTLVVLMLGVPRLPCKPGNRSELPGVAVQGQEPDAHNWKSRGGSGRSCSTAPAQYH